LIAFAVRFSQRYFEVVLAEEYVVTLAAGMACEGASPVVAIYSTFLQRAYDQLIHDVALQNLPVVFAIDRGGLVGADGATHHGAFDLSFLACVPNLVVMAPTDEDECRQMLYTAVQHPGPSAVRYPRGGGNGTAPQAQMRALPIGKGDVVRRGRGIALLAFGSMLQVAREVAETLDATVANMRFVKPLDAELVAELATSHELIVTLEENAVIGGAGAEVARVIDGLAARPRVLRLGLPDHFIDHGDQAQLLASVGLDQAGILASIARATGAPERA